MKKLYLYLVMSFIIISLSGCQSGVVPVVDEALMRAEINQWLDDFEAAWVSNDSNILINFYADPHSEIDTTLQEMYTFTLSAWKTTLDDVIFPVIEVQSDSFQDRQITIVDSTTVTVNCNEYTQYIENGSPTSKINEINLTLIKVNNQWKVSIYELVSTTVL